MKNAFRLQHVRQFLRLSRFLRQQPKALRGARKLQKRVLSQNSPCQNILIACEHRRRDLHFHRQ